MKTSKSFLVLGFILSTTIICSTSQAAGKKRGGTGALAGGAVSIGLGVGIPSTSQDEMNGVIKSAKTSINATTGDLNSAMEYMGHITMRLSNGWVALQLRPSYFEQSAHGTAANGAYDFDFNGFTVFPIVRFIPLSNDYIDFYIQGGLGYGELNGKITDGAQFSKFTGSGFGTLVGLGADFFITSRHSISVEGNYRYLPLARNIVKSANGMPTGISQNTPDYELETGGKDLGTRMSGIIGQVTYTFHF